MTSRTRYAILGVGGLALAVAVGLLVALALRSTSVSSAPKTPTPEQAPAAAQPEAGQPAPVQTVAPRPDPRVNECVDALGDGTLDLDSVQLALDGDLVVQFRLAGAIPAGESGLGLYIERNGNKAYQLGIALDDGDVDSVFVHDFDKSDVDDLDTDDVSIDGSTVTAVFPSDSIKRIGNDWSWYAFATAPGLPLDACPSETELLPFER